MSIEKTMNIDYPKLHIAETIAPFMREIVNGVPVTPVPRGWCGILIYHPATEQYYSTKSVSPMTYERIVREQKGPRWDTIAIALRKMLEHHPAYQFFILPVQARQTVEGWLSHQGKRRVATAMGEAANSEHVVFKVYSANNKFTRYVTAPCNTPREKIIAQANTSIAEWLKSTSSVNKHERDTMRVALRSLPNINYKVFEETAEVQSTNLIANKNHSEFRSVCINMNLKAIREFIMATTGL